MKKFAALFIVLTSFFIFIPQAIAAITETEEKLISSDIAYYDRFGHYVEIHGNYAIVGARYDDDNGSSSGSAYIFEHINGSWVEVAKLTASDGTAGDQFGISAGIYGDYAIIGAYGYDKDPENTNVGAAYVFERTGNTWSEIAKLTVSDGVRNDSFGLEVAIHGNFAIVGAHGRDDKGNSSGAAYIFENIGGLWTEVAKLTASDGTSDDSFGLSVETDGNYAFVGAKWGHNTGNTSYYNPDEGAVYIFKNNAGAWVEETKLPIRIGTIFINPFAIDGDRVLIGQGLINKVLVYELVNGNWTNTGWFSPIDGASLDGFGFSVSLYGDYAVVGAQWDDDHGSKSGSAYVFQRSGNVWSEIEKLTVSDGAASNYFGYNVSLYENHAMAAAYGNDSGAGDNSGAAYAYKIFEESPDLTVTHPNGGEALTKGLYYTINWNSSNITDSIQIDLYKGGTEPEHMLIQLAAAAPDKGSYPFNPPLYLESGDDYRIGISTEQGTIWDFSDNAFTIESEYDNLPDHFLFSTISSPQSVGTEFMVTITARDKNQNTVTGYNGELCYRALYPDLFQPKSGLKTAKRHFPSFYIDPARLC